MKYLTWDTQLERTNKMKLPKWFKRRMAPPKVTVKVKLKRGTLSPETWGAIQELTSEIVRLVQNEADGAAAPKEAL